MNQTEASPSSSKAATPLMQQYLSLKARYADEILFFRLGDFYEMFLDDALRAAPLLEVTLTHRQSIPMCGVPHHAATGYIAKLLKLGLSVAIAEQLEDPKKTKGMVRRDVVRVVTPGTIVEDELLPSKANNFLVAIAAVGGARGGGGHWALTAADVSTGRQWVGEVQNDFRWNALRSHLASLSPSEVLLVGDASTLLAEAVGKRMGLRFEPAPPTPSLTEQTLLAVKNYLGRDHAGASTALSTPLPLPTEAAGVMFLDETAIRHLELVSSSDAAKPGPTLLSVLDRSVTPLGGRLLRWWILHPSTDAGVIRDRLDHVESFVEASDVREALRGLLREIADLERILVRAQAGTASPRDLAGLRHALLKLPEIRAILTPAALAGGHPFFKLQENLSIDATLLDALLAQLADEPPARLSDGGVIREGVSPELDALRDLRRSGRKWIAEMEAAERARTGIGSLKIGYNDVFGYYLEVSRTNLAKVPAEWIRKQTLANGERYVTPALKEQEEKILGAEEKIGTLEAALYAELVGHVAAFAPSVLRVADAMAHLDAVAALAQAAVENGYVRPQLSDANELVIKGGRHPVVERQIGRDRYISNDVVLNAQDRIAIITGPNMAGKSTYLRQTALVAIMAQMGSFVPAESAHVGLVDKIFTRIGASDRLSQGQSTFMVEMQEVATLVLNATEKSLLILDEVGRGTSTYDGVSIAWAVVEHLAKINGSTGPRTLFATHYFELTKLPETLPGVFNAHATAKEWPGPDGQRQVVFLYQILRGAADRSYGIHVAEMAGVPASCIVRAREILDELEAEGRHLSKAGRSASRASEQMEFFGAHPIVDDLRGMNVDAMTPLEALNKLSELKEKARTST